MELSSMVLLHTYLQVKAEGTLEKHTKLQEVGIRFNH